MTTRATEAARYVFRELYGVVVSAGLMQKTVKVRIGGVKNLPQFQKTISKPKTYLVHDPNSSLVTGDVVSIVPGWRTSRRKRHVIKQIIAPYGQPVEARPPVPTLEERIREKVDKRSIKLERKAAKAQQS